MEKKGLLKYKGKKVFVIMKNAFHYEGNVLDITDVSLIMHDEFGKDLDIDIASISSILEKKNES